LLRVSDFFFLLLDYLLILSVIISYTLLELYRGILWWSKLRIENKKEKAKKIIELKHAQLNQGVKEEFPEMQEIQDILDSCYGMRFTEFPDYDGFRTKLVRMKEKNAVHCGHALDWLTPEFADL